MPPCPKLVPTPKSLVFRPSCTRAQRALDDRRAGMLLVDGGRAAGWCGDERLSRHLCAQFVRFGRDGHDGRLRSLEGQGTFAFFFFPASQDVMPGHGSRMARYGSAAWCNEVAAAGCLVSSTTSLGYTSHLARHTSNQENRVRVSFSSVRRPPSYARAIASRPNLLVSPSRHG